MFIAELPLAVVPVFINAGAALLPAILGALASVLALVLKPKLLYQAICKRPWVPLVALVLGGVIFFAVGQFTKPPAASVGKSRETSGVGNTDWSKVALEIIRQEGRSRTAPSIPLTQPPIVAQGTPPALVASDGLPVIYRMNAQRSGFAGGTAPRNLVPLWEYTEPSTMYLSSPVVHGNAVYGASCFIDPPATIGAIFKLDATTGQLLWQQDVRIPETQEGFTGFFSSPAITADGKSLIIGQGLHLDVGAELICLDTETGAIRWLVKTPIHIESSPAIEGDIVVVGAGSVEIGPDKKPQGDPAGRGHPGYVFAVRISDGKELWRYQVNDPESSPAIKDGIAYIGSGVNGNAVLALRIAPEEELAAKGLDRLVWRTETPFPAVGAVTLTDDLVLIGCGKGDFVFSAPDPEGVVMALDQKTGEVRWKTPLPDTVLASIAVKDGKAIIPVRNGEVMALDAKSGKVLWRQEKLEDRISGNSPILSGPAFSDGAIFAVSSNGYLAVIDPSNGAIVEKHYLNAPDRPGELGLCSSSPFVARGTLFIGTETGGLRAYTSGANP